MKELHNRKSCSSPSMYLYLRNLVEKLFLLYLYSLITVHAFIFKKFSGEIIFTVFIFTVLF